MTYRIKIVTYKNGETHYFPQIRRLGFWWCGIMHNGTECWYVGEFLPDLRREESLKTIDKHYEHGGNPNKRLSIQFEYITKP